MEKPICFVIDPLNCFIILDNENYHLHFVFYCFPNIR